MILQFISEYHIFRNHRQINIDSIKLGSTVFYEKLPDSSETRNPCCAASSPYPINGGDFFLASFFDNPTGASFLPTIYHINSNCHYP